MGESVAKAFATTEMTMTLLNYFRILLVTMIFALTGYQASWAADANFSWLPNDASDGTVGYILHYGTSSRVYTESIDVGSPSLVGGRVNANVPQLAPDQKYFFTVTAYNAAGQESTYANEVASTIPSDAVDDGTGDTGVYDILVTSSSNLSGAVALDGATVEGNLYVFTGPDTGVNRVIFSVDGVVTRTESSAPYELIGGSALDSSKLSPGQHEITAKIELSNGGSELVRSVFTIPSAEEGTGTETGLYNLLVTTSSNLSGAVVLDGTTVEGDIYVFTGPDTGVNRVIFSVDGVVTRTEWSAPYELIGGSAFDTSKLSPGQHEITADIQLNDGNSKIIKAIFTTPSANDGPVIDDLHDIYMSKSSNLSGATALDGAEVEGGIYVFTGPDTGVNRVIFSVDGVVTRTESYAPYELIGGSAFDTSKLSPGQHEITAKIELSDGNTEIVSAIFTVPYPNSIYDILVSNSSYLSGATALDGAEVDGDIYVFTGPDTGVKRVIFSIDGSVYRTENSAPYELKGGAAFKTSQLSKGTHQVSAAIELKDGSKEVIGASFVVK
jgi:hypothetical protein